ncbi:MAG: Fic family protein [Desulfitobacteriia bacterium]|jgi:Fic family protein
MSREKLPMLPPEVNLETNRVLKQLAKANRALAELKGYADTIPNKHILINAILIKEAKDSSEIENIVTTHDDLYKAMSNAKAVTPAAKEVLNYRTALWHGYELIKAKKMLTTKMIVEIQELIEKNNAGIRKLPGTKLLNPRTGEVIYETPDREEEIRQLLSNLERYINEDKDGVDPLIKMAVIHYQFECIHPFYDGNGRTGRIINVLYLVLKELLDSPILYLSGYIIRNKATYYNLLQGVRTKGNWEDWIVYILIGVKETAEETLTLVKLINNEIQRMSVDIKAKFPEFYSEKLIDLLCFEFYTKTKYIQKGLEISRKTAAKYLKTLEASGFLESIKIGRERIYLNKRLCELLPLKSYRF